MFGVEVGPYLRGGCLLLLLAGLGACTEDGETPPANENTGSGEVGESPSGEDPKAGQPSEPPEEPATESPSKPPVEPPANPAGDPAAEPSEPPEQANRINPILLQPAQADETAPATFRARFKTTKGDVVIESTRKWAPRGVDRFYTLVKHGYFTDVAFYRCVTGFMVQFGIHGDAEVRRAWSNRNILDDKVTQTNARGTISFAQGGNPNSRSVQLFINTGNNRRLDNYAQGFAPIGRVVEGMAVIDELYHGYGDMPQQRGRGPDPTQMASRGNEYLRASFPKLDYIESAAIVE